MFKRANCIGCHKWHGNGGGGYGGDALSLRKTELTREQIIETVTCGRPGTGMPFFVRGAYDTVKCYDINRQEAGSNMPPEANTFLRPHDIEAVADYVIAHIKDKGEPNHKECVEFFGDASRVCDVYKAQDAERPNDEVGAIEMRGGLDWRWLQRCPAGNIATRCCSEVAGNDLRDIRIGKPVAELPSEGYVDFACASRYHAATLSGWSDWRDCPAGADRLHALRFGFDPATSREGTVVAGHPAILTALIDNAGTVAGLKIDTDPKARLYLRKKAFLFGPQVKARYGADGWTCTQAQPEATEQPVGGVFVKEKCTKTIDGRALAIERSLFHRQVRTRKTLSTKRGSRSFARIPSLSRRHMTTRSSTPPAGILPTEPHPHFVVRGYDGSATYSGFPTIIKDCTAVAEYNDASTGKSPKAN